MKTMDKQEKIDIVNDALEVLYRELNDYSVHSDFPVEEVPHIAESILKLERLLEWLKGPTLEEFEILKGELKEND